jgi:hypothetical protein
MGLLFYYVYAIVVVKVNKNKKNMSENTTETERSQWGPPAEAVAKTPQQLLEERYSDREDPDDIDDMVILPGEGKRQEVPKTVLVRMHDDSIESLRVAGKPVNLDYMGAITPGEYVGVPEGPNVDTVHITQAVESSTLTPEAQEDLAREKSGLPLRGDKIIAKIDGKLTEATVVDYMLDSNDVKVAMVEGVRSGKRISADLRAFTPEIQALMDRDFKKQEFGRGVLATMKATESIKVSPTSEVIPFAPTATPEHPTNPKQERYNAVKKAMAEAIDGLSVIDAGYLDDYANAVYRKDHNTQYQVVNKMTKELVANTELIDRYVDLYTQKEEFFK